jgi:hypothetical protein
LLEAGVTATDPLVFTEPMPLSIDTLVAFVVDQLSVVWLPRLTVVGLVESDAVGG